MFVCAVVSVYDGDTLTCQSGVKVRLRAVDAPEIRGCGGRRGRICVEGDPIASKRHLQKLALGKRLRCRKDGGMSYKRQNAWCSAGGVDLSCAQVRAGYALHDVKYDRARRLCRQPG